jgi:hypothetical protein
MARLLAALISEDAVSNDWLQKVSVSWKSFSRRVAHLQTCNPLKIKAAWCILKIVLIFLED